MIPQIRPRDLAHWIEDAKKQGQPVVLDVREPVELQTASVTPDGFKLMAIPMRALPARLTEISPDTPIACLCHHGARSQQVASFLQANGYDHVVNIAGGINAWSSERDPAVPRY